MMQKGRLWSRILNCKHQSDGGRTWRMSVTEPMTQHSWHCCKSRSSRSAIHNNISRSDFKKKSAGISVKSKLWLIFRDSWWDQQSMTSTPRRCCRGRCHWSKLISWRNSSLGWCLTPWKMSGGDKRDCQGHETVLWLPGRQPALRITEAVGAAGWWWLWDYLIRLQGQVRGAIKHIHMGEEVPCHQGAHSDSLEAFSMLPMFQGILSAWRGQEALPANASQWSQMQPLRPGALASDAPAEPCGSGPLPVYLIPFCVRILFSHLQWC